MSLLYLSIVHVLLIYIMVYGMLYFNTTQARVRFRSPTMLSISLVTYYGRVGSLLRCIAPAFLQPDSLVHGRGVWQVYSHGIVGDSYNSTQPLHALKAPAKSPSPLFVYPGGNTSI